MENKNVIAGALVAGALVAGGVMLSNDKGPEATNFAEIAADGTVLRVIVADQDFIDSGAVGDPANWVPAFPEDPKENAGKGRVYNPRSKKFEDRSVQPAQRPLEQIDPELRESVDLMRRNNDI